MSKGTHYHKRSQVEAIGVIFEREISEGVPTQPIEVEVMCMIAEHQLHKLYKTIISSGS